MDDNKKPDETYREWAVRIARQEGLEIEVGEFYDSFIKQGDEPRVAAYRAMYEWDI